MRATFGYALCTLWYERQRFLPAIIAVALSTVLTAVQGGLLEGMFAFVSRPIDNASADIWVGSYPRPASWDLGKQLPLDYLSRLTAQPEVEWAEPFVHGFVPWVKPTGAMEMCLVVGSRLDAGSIGAASDLTPALRCRLTEPGTVVVDEEDLERLGVPGVGACTEAAGQRVRVVGVVHGFRGIAGAYLFCSLETARRLLRMRADRATYLVARCRHGADVHAAAARLAVHTDVYVSTREELSRHSRMHWLIKTRAGIALGGAAMLGLVVGTVVTSQTLYAATVVRLPQFAILWALGIPRRRMAGAVLVESGMVGAAGVVLALPAIFMLKPVADNLGATVHLPLWLLAGTIAVTMATTLGSGLMALRTLRRVEAGILLH
jgi:putative ABC transport system permease protein